jgi:hypothetical protein
MPMRSLSQTLGKRKHRRVAIRRQAFVYLDPDGVGMECMLEDISEGGVCLHVNDIPVRKIFVLQLSPQVRRLCRVQWRAGDRLGASFIFDVGRKKPSSTAPLVKFPTKTADAILSI